MHTTLEQDRMVHIIAGKPRIVHTIPTHAKFRLDCTPAQPRMEHNNPDLGPGRSISDSSICSIHYRTSEDDSNTKISCCGI